MPYIKKERRVPIEKHLEGIVEHLDNGGDLNYALTRICHLYGSRHELNYENLSTIIASLECAKLEIYRRIVSPYEDFKIKVNGDLP